MLLDNNFVIKPPLAFANVLHFCASYSSDNRKILC